MKTVQMVSMVSMVLCLAVVGEAAWVYSRDGTNATASARSELPVQGVSLTTGEVVVGLPARGTAVWVDCGYWPVRMTPKPEPVSNEVYRVGGWVLDRSVPEARPVWTPSVPRRRAADYSKRKVYRALKDLGVWDAARDWMEAEGVWEDWEFATTLESDDPLVEAAVPALAAAAGMTEAGMREVLEKCRVSR